MNEILFYDRPDLVERIANALKQPVGAMHKDAVMYWSNPEVRGVQLPPAIVINGNVSTIESNDDAEEKLIATIIQQARKDHLLMLWSYSIRDYEDHSRITARGIWSQLPQKTHK